MVQVGSRRRMRVAAEAAGAAPGGGMRRRELRCATVPGTREALLTRSTHVAISGVPITVPYT
ncbi:hypothetical protein [Paenibacillus sp. BC26]|uniref:hypothetical protein n=1 Tax=Paenibacillus sp. BC26 TaxID=1881032 RepID=UPI0011604030|nr:hypothetical protein [Paenibacillus sp. BC26]